jgi:periplasmic divalent cation tolerance protein
MTDAILVFTTASSEEEAKQIARGLVERHLAACVNIVPRLHSIYRWQGKIEEAEEYLLIIKTTAENFAELSGAIKELHCYDLPECIAIPITDGVASYLNWISDALQR